MSLREEIENYLDRFSGRGPNIIDNYDVDDLIKIFVKRIDSCLEEQSKYHEDYAEGLHRLKEMLLK